MTAARYQDLLGATLDHVTLDWRNGTARLTFLPARGSHEAHAIRASGLSRLLVSRTPGASSIVRDATPVTTGDRASVSLRMETGEVVEIEATTLVLEGVGG